ncbi:MAG: CpsD/CapB family tyrosine-protein kinase [Leptolyngbyaceae cyanobacterium SL_7_1]|nr:CpsD/CapB family tyrosine-protein kinase [Leptolyngbyaceae cyanobacterium SL_7_1]
MLDLCDRSVKTVGEAKDLLDLPILGVIPMASNRAPALVLTDDSNGYMTQAYRMLQANLSFVSAHTGCKVIVVTSAVAQEGRSWVAANLALAMSQAGSKVLLVDADLRQPTQHQIWNCPNDRGLVQVLEKTAEAEMLMQPVATNVFLLPLGKQSPNSLATFSAKQLNFFVQQAAQSFDIVLFDTPPLTQTADASTLGTLADGTLMVIRPGLVKAADVKAAKGLLKLARAVGAGHGCQRR